MVKSVLSIAILMLFVMAGLFSQNPALPTEAAPAPMEGRQPGAELGQVARDEFEQKQFAGQIRKMRDGLAKGDFNKTAALQSSLLTAMRREIGQMRAAISAEINMRSMAQAEPTASTGRTEKNAADLVAEKPKLDIKKEELNRMELILAEIQSFTFSNDNREVSESKLKLIEEFGGILQKYMVEGHQNLGPEKSRGRN